MKKKKTGGRKKGTPNKSTKFLYDYLNDKGECLIERVMNALPNLSEDRQIDIYLKLLPYVYCKPVAIAEEPESAHSKIMQLIDLRLEKES